jgi:hypothetical protein
VSADVWNWSWWSGGLWPYLAVIVFGFLPSEFWRMLSIFVASGIDEKSEILEWVRAVSTALLAAVVANIVLAPAGALALAPLWARIGAMLLGLAVYFALRKSVLAGVFAGVSAIAVAATYYAP